MSLTTCSVRDVDDGAIVAIHGVAGRLRHTFDGPTLVAEDCAYRLDHATVVDVLLWPQEQRGVGWARVRLFAWYVWQCGWMVAALVVAVAMLVWPLVGLASGCR